MTEIISQALWYPGPGGKLVCTVCGRLQAELDQEAHDKSHFRGTYFRCCIPGCYIGSLIPAAFNHLKEKGESHQLNFFCMYCSHWESDLTAYISHLRSDEVERRNVRRPKSEEPLLPKCPQPQVDRGQVMRRGIPPSILRKLGLLEKEKCSICDEAYAVQSHIERHFNMSSYVCGNCNLVWLDYNIQLLRDLLKGNDSGHDFVFFCHICKVCNNPEAHFAHLRDHEDQKNQMNKLNMVASSQIMVDPLCVSSCGSLDIAHKKGHVVWHAIVKCIVCQETMTKNNLPLHMKGHYCDIRMFCLICLEISHSDIIEALRHANTHETPTTARARTFIGFVCLYCGVATSSIYKDAIANHLIHHRKNKSVYKPVFECREICSMISCRPDSEVEFELGSQLCTETFADVDKLLAHVRRHAGMTYTVPTVDDNVQKTIDIKPDVPPPTSEESNSKSSPSKRIKISCSPNRDCKEEKPELFQNGMLTTSDLPPPTSEEGNSKKSSSKRIKTLCSPDRDCKDKKPKLFQNGKLTTSALTNDSSFVTPNSASAGSTVIKLEPSVTLNEPARNSTLSNTSHIKKECPSLVPKNRSKAKIRIFPCKVCGKRFVAEHFFRMHLEKSGH